MRKAVELVEKYPGIALDIVFASGLLSYLGLWHFIEWVRNANLAFWIVPAFQLHALILASAWPSKSEVPDWAMKLIRVSMLVLIVGPLFPIVAQWTFLGDKRGDAFALSFLRIAYTSLTLVATFFILTLYENNVMGRKTKEPGKFARPVHNYANWLAGAPWRRILLTLLVVPLYFELLQLQMGWGAVGSVFSENFSFERYWSYLFYGGNLFVMIYFLAARVLILIRPPYAKLEFVTATLGFLKFAGFLALLGFPF